MMPTMPDVAPLISQDAGTLEDYRNRAIRMLSISGMSGFPQISLPMAHRLGVPLGFSLLGPAGSDSSLIRLSQQLMSG
jgi:amidase